MGRLRDFFKKESRAEKLQREASSKGETLFPSLTEAPLNAWFSEDDDAVLESEFEEIEVEVEPEIVIIPPKTAEELSRDVLERSKDFKGAGTVGSESEKAAARALRDTAGRLSNVKTRMEPFYARPLLGKSSFIFAAAMLLLALIFYFGYVPVALVFLLVGFPLAVLLTIGFFPIAFLLPKKPAYNVTATLDPVSGEPPKRTIMLVSSYGSEYGSTYATKRLRRFTGAFMIGSFAAVLALLVFSIVRLAMGTPTASDMKNKTEIVVMTVIPIVLTLPAIFYFATYTSWDKNNITPNNLLGAFSGLAAVEYFSEHPDELPADTRLMFVSFSATDNGNTGAYSFLKQHEKDGTLENVTVLEIGDVVSKDFTIVDFDYATFKASDKNVSAKLAAAMEKNGASYDVRGKGQIDAGHHSYAPFAKVKIPSASFALKRYREYAVQEDSGMTVADAETVQKVIEITVDAVKTL